MTFWSIVPGHRTSLTAFVSTHEGPADFSRHVAVAVCVCRTLARRRCDSRGLPLTGAHQRSSGRDQLRRGNRPMDSNVGEVRHVSCTRRPVAEGQGSRIPQDRRSLRQQAAGGFDGDGSSFSAPALAQWMGPGRCEARDLAVARGGYRHEATGNALKEAPIRRCRCACVHQQ